MVQALPSAKSFTNIQAMITALNSYSNTEMNVGTSIYLQQTDVPDFWVYSKADSSVAYTYTDDSAFISAIETSGYVQVGYYNVAMLETAKVDLSDYYTKEEINDLISNIDLSNYVNRTNNQTIGGIKTFKNEEGCIKLREESSNVTYGFSVKGNNVILGNVDNLNSFASSSVCISMNSRSTAFGSILIGSELYSSGEDSIVIGSNTGGGMFSIQANAEGAIQLGKSYLNMTVENNTPYLFQVYDYPLLDGTSGKVPNERLSDDVLISDDTLILDGGNSVVNSEA